MFCNFNKSKVPSLIKIIWFDQCDRFCFRLLQQHHHHHHYDQAINLFCPRQRKRFVFRLIMSSLVDARRCLPIVGGIR
ncbi:hypothetical protein BLOT_008625 [Blomia tropicalis]|nr:hypothetical protein BLOT_008625 [Blomia tropicalis]